MEVQRTPEGKATPDVPQLNALQALLADVCSNLERVHGLKTKLEAAAAGTDKGLQEVRVCQRAVALDNVIEQYESRRVRLESQIQLVTVGQGEQGTASTQPRSDDAKDTISLEVEPEQALVQEALAEEPKQEPQDLVQDAQLEEPKQQPQDNVVASHALAVDFSGVLEDDWSDVHVKEDWLVPADEGENTVDISAVFEADDICIDTTLAQPNGSDDHQELDLGAISCQSGELHQPEDLSLPTDEELLNDSVLNEAFGNGALTEGACMIAPDTAMRASAMRASAPEDASQGRQGDLDPFLNTACADVDDSTLLTEHDMLLSEVTASLPTGVPTGDEAHPLLSLDPISEAPDPLVPMPTGAAGGTDFLDGEVGCPVVDLMFDFDLENEFASGQMVQLCCSGSEGQALSAGDRAPAVDAAAGEGVPACQDRSADGAASGYTPRAQHGREPTSADLSSSPGRLACMHGDAPSGSDSEVAWGLAGEYTTQRAQQGGAYRRHRTQRLVSLTPAETSALPDVLAAAQQVRRVLAPRQCGQHPAHDAADAGGKENCGTGRAASKAGAQQGKGRRRKRSLSVEESDSEDEWTPSKPAQGTRRKGRPGKPSAAHGAAAAAAAVGSESGASGSSESEGAHGSVFLLSEASIERFNERASTKPGMKPSLEAGTASDPARYSENVNSMRSKRPLKLKLKALRRDTDAAERPAAATGPRAAASAVVTGDRASPAPKQSAVDERSGSGCCAEYTVSALRMRTRTLCPGDGAAMLDNPCSSTQCGPEQPASSTGSGKSACNSSQTAAPAPGCSTPVTDSGDGDAPTALNECELGVRKKRRVAASSPEPVCSPVKPPQQPPLTASSAQPAPHTAACAPEPALCSNSTAAEAAPSEVAAGVPPTDPGTAEKRPLGGNGTPPEAGTSTGGKTPGFARSTVGRLNKGGHAADAAATLKRNPLKRTMVRNKPVPPVSTTPAPSSQQPCKSKHVQPTVQQAPQPCPAPLAPVQRAVPGSNGSTQQSPTRPVPPPPAPTRPPPPTTPSVKPPQQRLQPRLTQVGPTSTGPAGPSAPPQQRLPAHLVPHPPKCPPPGPPPSGPSKNSPASLPHPVPCTPQPPGTAHAVAARASRHHACIPGMSPCQKPRAPNAVYPSLRAQSTPASVAPPPLVLGALGVAPEAHTPRPPKCAPPAPPADEPCNVGSVDHKLKMEPMPDLSILCDIMRAAEAPADDAAGHKHAHPQEHTTTPHQGVRKGGASQHVKGAAGHATAAPPSQNPNKSRRERLKALRQGSSRNIGEWGRRQGYHRERVTNAEKRRGSSGLKGKQAGAVRKHCGELKVQAPGRALEAMRNRGAQPLVGATCSKGNKTGLDLPQDTDLFGC